MVDNKDEAVPPAEQELITPVSPAAETIDTSLLDTGRIVRETEEISAAAAQGARAAEEADEEPKRSGLNVLSVISLVLALALSPLAVIFGYVAIGQVRRAGQRGEAIAWVAVVLGWLVLIGWVVAAVTAWLIWSQL